VQTAAKVCNPPLVSTDANGPYRTLDKVCFAAAQFSRTGRLNYQPRRAPGGRNLQLELSRWRRYLIKVVRGLSQHPGEHAPFGLHVRQNLQQRRDAIKAPPCRTTVKIAGFM
jgi:hypothetical protein